MYGRRLSVLSVLPPAAVSGGRRSSSGRRERSASLAEGSVNEVASSDQLPYDETSENSHYCDRRSSKRLSKVSQAVPAAAVITADATVGATLAVGSSRGSNNSSNSGGGSSSSSNDNQALPIVTAANSLSNEMSAAPAAGAGASGTSTAAAVAAAAVQVGAAEPTALSSAHHQRPPPPLLTSPSTASDGLTDAQRLEAKLMAERKLKARHTGYSSDPEERQRNSLCTFILTVVSVFFIVLTAPFSLLMCIKIVQEYERAVIFRLGRILKGGARGPGLFFIIPCIDNYTKVDLRTVSFDVPPQEILTRDSVTVAVDAVVYYRIQHATIAVTNVEDYGRSTRLLAATTLRNVLGTKDLSQILSERESISHIMQMCLDDATDSWGVKVERVEIKDVRLPVQMQRAMAAEAEASREARAKVIGADGEKQAARSLKEAADIISESKSALQLRYLQTLTSIAAEKNSTIVFPLPLELFRDLLGNESHGCLVENHHTAPPEVVIHRTSDARDLQSNLVGSGLIPS